MDPVSRLEESMAGGTTNWNLRNSEKLKLLSHIPKIWRALAFLSVLVGVLCALGGLSATALYRLEERVYAIEMHHVE